jgi:orotidine-5'-phosphate decarboxylase
LLEDAAPLRTILARMSTIFEVASAAKVKSTLDRLIVALDVPNADAARRLVSQLSGSVGMFKVGLQLFTAEGPGLVRELVKDGHRVFLDLKLHDIPNTVSHAVHSAVDLGVSMLTVHASAGSEGLQVAAEASGNHIAVVAVTVLTSFSDQDLQGIGVPHPVAGQVLHLAALARAAGCAGVVTSPRETAQVRQAQGTRFAIVNPGVRPAGSQKDDQERTATPGEAIRSGATYVVVGRPITKAENPAKAAYEIVQEMETAVSGS